jgi:hypothetical protein
MPPLSGRLPPETPPTTDLDEDGLSPPQVLHDRRVGDAEWRKWVVDQFRATRKAMRENAEAHQKGVEENTVLTQELKNDVEEIKDKLQVPLAAWDKIATGLKVIGWIGSFAEWVAKKWFFLLLAGLAAKLLISGGTWKEVWDLMHSPPP